jgi:hypothetical protein
MELYLHSHHSFSWHGDWTFYWSRSPFNKYGFLQEVRFNEHFFKHHQFHHCKHDKCPVLTGVFHNLRSKAWFSQLSDSCKHFWQLDWAIKFWSQCAMPTQQSRPRPFQNASGSGYRCITENNKENVQNLSPFLYGTVWPSAAAPLATL